MPFEAGRQSDDLGPFIAAPGMDAGRAEAGLQPHIPELLFNVDLDRTGRAVPRPGSVFFARLGAGSILGIDEHTFETGSSPRKMCAVVADAYAVVNNLGSASDGAGTGSVGFCPDVSINGQVITPILAVESDRFHFQSFLNRLYYAGSTVDHAIHEHNYATGVDTILSGIKGTSIASQGNRLFVAGDPAAPNVVYPSDPDDPYTWQPQLGFQIGLRTDGILKLMEHNGLLLVFGERTASWALVGAVELGDVQVETFSKQHGIVGALAADEAGDGWVYWITPNEGPMRWRRGASAPDSTFAEEVYEIFQTVERGTSDMSAAVVRWDPAAQAVRFELPNTDILLSYFPRKGTWSYGASTTSLDALDLREKVIHEEDIDLGAARYTALAYRRDQQDDNDKLYGGDTDGIIWTWTPLQPDKVRSGLPGELGTGFTCAVRFGNTEIAPIGYRAVIEQLILDVVGSYEFQFTVWGEMDYSEFLELETVVVTADGGTMPLLLDDGTDQDTSLVFDQRLHPMHARVSNWERSVGKVVRLMVTWDGVEDHMAFIGFEMERSLEPHGADQVQTPPTAQATALSFLSSGEGASTFDGSGTTTEPHAPPAPADGTIATVDFIVTGEIFDAPNQVATTSTDPDVPGDCVDPAATDWINSTWTNGNRVRACNIAVSADGDDTWILVDSGGSSLAGILMHLDTSTFGSPVKSYEYDIYSEIPGGVGSGADRFDTWGMFYSDVTQRLYIPIHTTDGQAHGMMIYDVSTPTSTPTLLCAQTFATTVFNRLHSIELTDDERHCFIGDWGNAGTPSGAGLYALSINAAGTSISQVDRLAFGVGGQCGTNAGIHMRRMNKQYLCVTVTGTAINQSYVHIVDISNPAGLSLVGSLELDAALSVNNTRPTGVTVSTDNQVAWVEIANDGVGLGIVKVDISNVASPAYVSDVNVDSVQEEFLGNPIHYVESDRGLDPFVVALSAGTAFQTWDPTVNPPTLIDTGGSPEDCGALGCPRGPQSNRYGSSSGAYPTPVDANVGVVSAFGAGGKGVAVLIGLDDFTAPSLDAFVQHSDLVQVYGPSVAFSSDGDYLCVLGGNNGWLYVYSLGGTFAEVSRTQDTALQGCNGLVAAASGIDKLYSLNSGGEIVEIDLTDPAAPVITETAAGPTYLTHPTGQPELRGATDLGLMGMQHGPTMFSKSSFLRTGSALPIESWGLKALVHDGTYAYAWNEWEGGGLAVLDITDDDVPLTGYVHVGTINDGVKGLLKNGNFIYAWFDSPYPSIEIFDVTTPGSPTHLATHACLGVNQLAANGANEIVAFAGGSTRSTFTVRRINVTTPATPSDTSTFTSTRRLIAGNVNTGVAIAFDSAGNAIRYTLGAPPAETHVVAITDASAGDWLLAYPVAGYVAGIFRAGSASKLVVIDIADASEDGRVGNFVTPNAWHLDDTNDNALVVGITSFGPLNTCYTVDLSTPTAPTIDATFRLDELDRGAYAPFVLSDVAVVGRDLGYGGLVVVDLSTLATPATTRFLGDPWIATKNPSLFVQPCVVRGASRAIMASPAPSFRVYDVALPLATPRVDEDVYTELSASPTEFGRYASAINDGGTRLFLGRKVSGVWYVECYNVSSPGSIPAVLGSVSLGSRVVQAIRVSGTGLEIVVLHGGVFDIPRVTTYDFTTESAPVKLGEVQLGSSPFIANRLELF